VRGYVLVGGWPASGKTTLARALAFELGVAYFSKDQVKEALMDALGPPSTVAESQRLGRAAVFAVLRAAQGCPAAIIDSTWFPYATGLVDALGGPFVEIRCEVDIDVARERYKNRMRDPRHLDTERTEAELWANPVPPLGVDSLIRVDTNEAVDVAAVASLVLKDLLPG
jgi:predicted kinase